MIPQSPNQIRLSAKERRFIAWSNKPVRRIEHIPKYSTLPRVSRRLYKCESCNKTFNSPDVLKRHAQITHTGTKPIVCEICDRRFCTERHMASHYHIHNEPRLEEFNVLLKRTRKIRSLPTSFTTVGSYVGVPKGLKTYMSEPTFKSFGTKQSFYVSERNEKIKAAQEQEQAENHGVYNYNETDDGAIKSFMTHQNNNGENIKQKKSANIKSARRVEFSATTRQYSDVSSRSEAIRRVHEAQMSQRSSSRSLTSESSQPEEVLRTKLPSVQPSRRSGAGQREISRSAKTDTKSSSSLRKLSGKGSERLETLTPIIRTSTPKSRNTKSSYSEAHRQLYSENSAPQIWDIPGYSKTSSSRRMSVVTSISGYDPFINLERSPRKSTLKSVKSDSFSDFI